jgi:hypothetical protein
MSQVILRYPYVRVDFWDDPDMVLPPREVFDHRGMLIDDVDMYVFLFFEIAFHMYMIYMLILYVVCLHMKMWHLAGTRWSCRERRLVRRQRDCHREREVGVRMPWGDQLHQRGQRGDVGLMTLVLGHHTLLWRLSE